MLERKTLAYGDGKIERPRITKSLVFATALAAALSACSPPAHAIPRRDPILEESRAMRAPISPQEEIPQARCLPEITSLGLEAGETVTETVCRGNREFVLSDRALYIRTVTNDGEAEGSSIRLISYHSRTDMSSILARGLVDWEATEDACYFLARDRRLTVLPNEGMEDTVPVFELPFETAGLSRNRMIFHFGHLFIAPPEGDIIMMAFTPQFSSTFLPIRSAGRRAGFFTRGDRLFFGRKGIEEREIRIEGAGSAR
jgi:hypothetical protein